MIERDVEGLEVEILFVAQIGHCKLANAVDVLDITTRGIRAVIGCNGFFRQKISGDIGNVIAVVGGLWPTRVARLNAACARLSRVGEGLYLHPASL